MKLQATYRRSANRNHNWFRAENDRKFFEWKSAPGVKMRRTRIEHMSAGPPQIADIARRGWHGRKVPTSGLCRRSPNWNLWNVRPPEPALLRLDVGRPDHLGPFGLLGDQLPKSGGEPAITVPPRSANRALNSGSAWPALISLLSLSTIAMGVSFGETTPAQKLDS